MKSRTSVIIGMVMLIIAGGFVAFAMQHPELSFRWSQRLTFMLYGAYIWFIFRFLVDIPVFRRNRKKIGKSTVRAVIFFMMAVVFLVMEMTGDTVNIYTIIRGFIVVGACDVAVENIKPYENLTNCTAAPYASYLLKRGASSEEIATAYELVRFSEDQFVYWDMPVGEKGYKRDATPCVYEQYKYTMPVDASTCNVSNAMLDLYGQTGDELMFAKAKALIDNITVVQCVNTGKIPTTWRIHFGYNPTFWTNCSYSSICTLLRLDELTK